LNFRLLDDPETQHTTEQVAMVCVCLYGVNCQQTRHLLHYLDSLLSNNIFRKWNSHKFSYSAIVAYMQ